MYDARKRPTRRKPSRRNNQGYFSTNEERWDEPGYQVYFEAALIVLPILCIIWLAAIGHGQGWW